ncbi:DUF4352 domain-containing protein [Candidatus Dojkabacteria bacterium]|uniref:DUF4352 domain-containing protein n=1 Tax=Candidatus Dojkabacteria bacterium TaxID=2099670 RepID=A0A955L8H2_9BACT|nr:DUF4352 domain-containing protein [Candidatus Dojkabacteria bacterium]
MHKSGSKKNWLLVLIGIPFLCMLCVICTAIFLMIISANSEPPRTPTSNEIQPTPIVTPNDFYSIGQTTQINGHAITVHAVDNSVALTNDTLQPGIKSYAVEVSITNTENTPFTPTTSHFQLFDEKGYTYIPSTTIPKKPDFISRTLDEGDTVRGWLTFEVQQDSDSYTLTYKPDLVQSEIISFVL